jgi:type II secretory pathway predicted ATPase ExeA
MYTTHFGLTRFPFEKNIAPDEVFPSAGLTEARVRLRHLVDMTGVGVITGDSGSGKSTTTRVALADLHPGLYKVIYVPLSTGNPMDMYKTIAWEMGLPTERSRAALYRQIRTEVTRLSAEARIRPLLVLDEAQALRSDVLEEMRLLTNYAMDSENRLCLVFSGQSELRRRLSMAVHEALNRRVIVRFHVPPLARDELGPYLAHLLRRAGTELPLFEPAAIEAIYQATHGLPGKVNPLAHHALMAAALAKAKTVTVDHVQAAQAEVT